MEGKRPMACGDDFKTQLSRYVDGELTPEERTRVDEHVGTCVPCRELLQIFQKNESLLSNALSTESFGNSVIEAVIGEIKRDGEPVEAKPAEEVVEGFRGRPLLQLAAAALLVVGLVAILSTSHSREMATLQGKLDQMAKAQQDLSQRLTSGQEEHYRLIESMRVKDALQHGPERGVLGYITPQHLMVRASFDPKLYGSFAIYRRAEGQADDQFTKLKSERLESPEYIDASVKPGQAYVYKFRAYRTVRDDDFVESLPIVMRVPRVQEMSPEKGIRVHCSDIAVNRIAKFILTRVVDGRTVSEEFFVKPGERLGEVKDVAGVGLVDFRTNLTLERLEYGNQTLAVSYTRALLDPNGQPVMESISKDGTVVVKTEQQEGVLSIRPNARALFRTPGAPAADVDIWKSSWLQVRAQE
jgi:hypothetical protein